MQVYRIAHSSYIDDIAGEGARLHGGRWNHPGTPVLYTASTIALAAWEVRVHLPNDIIPREDAFSLATISIPELSILEVPHLLDTWKSDMDYTRNFGQSWILDQEFLCLKVPSSVIENEYNYLINPLHALATSVMLVDKRQFVFDHRTFQL